MINLNIHMQVIGLILAVMLVYMNTTRKKIGLVTDFAFEVLLLSVTGSIFFDIASIFTINGAALGQCPESVNMFVCKTYIVMLSLVAGAVFNYTLTEIYGGDIMKRRYLLGFVLLEALTVPAVYVLPLYYHVDKNSIYSYGESTDIGVATGFVFLVLTLVYIVIHRKEMDVHRRNAVAIFCAAMTVSAAFQNFNREHLLASVTIGIGIVFVYLELEDPGSYLNKDTGSFNMRALEKYLDGVYSEGKRMSLLNISFSGHRFLKEIYGEKFHISMMKSIVDYLEKYKSVAVFNTDDMDFIVVFGDSGDFENEVFRIRRDLMSLWNVDGISIELSPLIIAIPRDNVPYDNANAVIESLRYFAAVLKDGSDKDYIMVDNALIKEKEKNDRLEELLIEAMEKENIEAHFQPLYDVRTGKISGAEALARVMDANGEIIGNEKILPIAERSGMILRLGFRVFEGVCRLLSKNDPAKLGLVRVGINLSTTQCMQRTLADDMIDIMKLYNLEGKHFIFEINENAISYSKDMVLRNIKKLTAYGCEVAIDRFGSGLGDLVDLTELNISIVKLDRDFIKRAFQKKDDEMLSIGMAVVKLLNRMGKMVAAVGIENEEQYELLKEAGVLFVQGRYFSDAVDADRLLELCGKEVNTDEQG
ncbi:MAG: EAL domain-containing protein [Lachnospiraceae bacterium]|nr:EAL domain-containing protein [Lachnospiraceae bacterium]